MSLNRRDRIRLLEAPDSIGMRKTNLFQVFPYFQNKYYLLNKIKPLFAGTWLICLAVQLHRVSQNRIRKNWLLCSWPLASPQLMQTEHLPATHREERQN
jgi:hypothetical protein